MHVDLSCFNKLNKRGLKFCSFGLHNKKFDLDFHCHLNLLAYASEFYARKLNRGTVSKVARKHKS